ncbi:MAG: hypothetical protein LBJ20_05840 [Candidatus Methanoplasma sp.]|nr:hypothetical protein [Candidatus Methanoplasma sp.]
MRSFEERWNSIKDDPKKFKRLFTFVWITAYLMFIIGLVLIIGVFLYT